MNACEIMNVEKTVVDSISVEVRPHEFESDLVSASAQKRLQVCGYPELKNVRCECREGVLVLRGCVTSYFQMQLAQEAVRKLPGVEAVFNAIEVAGKAATRHR